MEISRDTLDNYQKNLWCLRTVTEELLGQMKGHGLSFRAAVTDKSGRPDQEKLCALVTELLDGWADYVRDGLYPDQPGGESPAESYLRARRELYSLYLYLTMRTSLCEGAFALARDREDVRERTDFAFLLEQARRFSRAWCVMAGPDGTRRNEPYEGFDAYFGFHLYGTLTDPEGRSRDSALTPWWSAPAQDPSGMTNEGAMKRVYLKRLSPPPEAEKPEEEPAGDAEYDYDYDDEDYGGDMAPEEDGWEPTPFGDILAAGEMERLSEEDRASGLAALAAGFREPEDYIEACQRFAALYRRAPAEVLRGFSEEIEEIIDLYLLRRGQTVLTDTDRTLDVYSRIYDGPGRQAARYARGLQWDSL